MIKKGKNEKKLKRIAYGDALEYSTIN